MVKVYFETDSYAEEIATFSSDAVYIACLPALEDIAIKFGFNKVTESEV
jgi:Mg2+/citrate symporter